jgi:hypothetical protein
MVLRLGTFLSRLGTLAFAGYLAWLGWEALGPRKPDISAARREVADRLIPAIVEDLRAARGDLRSVALLHFENDPSDYITDRLRQEIEQSGILDLRDRTVAEKARNLLGLRHPGYDDTAAAVAAGRDLAVAGVIFGRIHAFESGRDGSRLDMEVRFAAIDDGRLLLDRRYSKEPAGGVLSAAAAQEHFGRIGLVQRFLGWALAVLLLPVFTIGFIRAMVRKESNRSNALTLGVYTGAALLLAYLLFPPDLASWLSVALFVVLVGAAFAYNVVIMTFALKLERT